MADITPITGSNDIKDDFENINTNDANLNTQLVNHIAGTADRHKTSEVDDDSSVGGANQKLVNENLQGQISTLILGAANETIGVFSAVDAVNTNGYAVTTGVAAYFIGWKINLTVANNNTGNATLNPDGKGAQPVKVEQIDGTFRECQVDEVSGTVQVEWDGTQWKLISSKSFDDYNRPVLGGGLLINGNFDIWQRGVNFSAASTYTSDRWYIFGSTQLIDRVANDNNLIQSKFNFQLNLNNAVPVLYQQIENQNNILLNRKSTLTFWVKADKALTVKAQLAKNSFSTVLDEFTYNITTSWTKITITFDADATWVVDDIIFLTLGRAFSDSTAIIKYAQVKFEIDNIATKFIPKSFAEELRDCLRYYISSLFVYGNTGNERIANGQCISTTSARLLINFPENMRIPPTFSLSNSTHFSLTKSDGLLQVVTSISQTIDGNQTAYLTVDVASGLLAGNATTLMNSNVLADLQFDAEL